MVSHERQIGRIVMTTDMKVDVRMGVEKRIRLGVVGLVAALVGGLLLVATASAAVQGVLSVGSADLAPGATGTVSLTASVPSPGLGAWTVDVIVGNPSQVSVESCSAPSDSVCNPHYPGSSPTVRFAGATATGRIGQATLGSITFRCASTEGSSPLALRTVGFADATVGGPVEIAVTMNPGTIRCARPTTSTPGGGVATATPMSSTSPS